MYPVELFCFLVGVAFVSLILASIARNARKALAVLAMVILICEGGLLAVWIFISMQFHGLGDFAPIVTLLILATIICGIWSGNLISASPKGNAGEASQRPVFQTRFDVLVVGRILTQNKRHVRSADGLGNNAT